MVSIENSSLFIKVADLSQLVLFILLCLCANTNIHLLNKKARVGILNKMFKHYIVSILIQFLSKMSIKFYTSLEESSIKNLEEFRQEKN